MSLTLKVFKAGDIVLNSDQPFVIQINDEERDKRCHYCFNECADLKSCGQCHQVDNCSKECQLKDWKDIHKYNECKLLKEYKPMVGETLEIGRQAKETERIVIRFLLKVTFDKKSLEKVYNLWDYRQREFNDLISHEVEYRNQDPLSYAGLSLIYKHYFLMFANVLNVELRAAEIYRLDFILNANKINLEHPFQFSGKTSYAKAVYIDGSAFNHDCKPSCYVWFNGRTMQVRAMRTIDTSVEQPTISYINRLGFNRRIRRKNLFHKKIVFECQCKRCVENEDKDIDFDRYRSLEVCKLENKEEIWDEMIELKRHMMGQHFPDITYSLYGKWLLIDTQLNVAPNKNDQSARDQYNLLIRQRKELTEELEREVMITHGREHTDYEMIMKRIAMSKNVNHLVSEI